MSVGRIMLKYLINDLSGMTVYFPYCVIVALAVFLVAVAGNIGRKAMGKERRPILATTFFITYVFVIIAITFLSRETGTSLGVDLQIGSTWGINARNNAYVIENILLFVPFGLFAAWSIPAMRNLINGTFWGILFSLGIECLQLYTQRGYFQIDDIITNVLGTLVGIIIFHIIHFMVKE